MDKEKPIFVDTDQRYTPKKIIDAALYALLGELFAREPKS